MRERRFHRRDIGRPAPARPRPGSPDTLERYAAWRSFDSLALVAVTDGINRHFANDIWPLKLARETGLAIVDRCRRQSASSCATPWG
jgi:2-polyprenyl-6-methoxyphenol hydroxylase-like FAD-dependent oxidoreductase